MKGDGVGYCSDYGYGDNGYRYGDGYGNGYGCGYGLSNGNGYGCGYPKKSQREQAAYLFEGWPKQVGENAD